MMKFETFERVVHILKKNHEKIHQLYKLGIDLTEINDDLHDVISMLINSMYGVESAETFDWWCYEKEWGTRKDITFTDKDGNKLCETIEELYNYMEENKSDDYVLKKPLTDKEREELLCEMFKRFK
jgi:hypothetical protein